MLTSITCLVDDLRANYSPQYQPFGETNTSDANSSLDNITGAYKGNQVIRNDYIKNGYTPEYKRIHDTLTSGSGVVGGVNSTVSDNMNFKRGNVYDIKDRSNNTLYQNDSSDHCNYPYPYYKKPGHCYKLGEIDDEDVDVVEDVVEDVVDVVEEVEEETLGSGSKKKSKKSKKKKSKKSQSDDKKKILICKNPSVCTIESLDPLKYEIVSCGHDILLYYVVSNNDRYHHNSKHNDSQNVNRHNSIQASNKSGAANTSSIIF